MKVLRIALGFVVGAYAVFCLFPIAANALYKAGGMPAPTGEAARMVPLWAATPWWELAAWVAVVGLLLLVAMRLILGRAALGLYLLAIVANGALWWVMHAGEAYQQAFTPAELQLDYASLAATILVAVLIWLAERRPATRTASA